MGTRTMQDRAYVEGPIHWSSRWCALRCRSHDSTLNPHSVDHGISPPTNITSLLIANCPFYFHPLPPTTVTTSAQTAIDRHYLPSEEPVRSSVIRSSLFVFIFSETNSAHCLFQTLRQKRLPLLSAFPCVFRRVQAIRHSVECDNLLLQPSVSQPSQPPHKRSTWHQRLSGSFLHLAVSRQFGHHSRHLVQSTKPSFLHLVASRRFGIF
jgi:hypothetical protein